VGRKIVRSLVGLGLDDPADLHTAGARMDQVHAEQVTGNEQRFARIKRTGQLGHAVDWQPRKGTGLFSQAALERRKRGQIYFSTAQAADE
jgi:hypothetical protein